MSAASIVEVYSAHGRVAFSAVIPHGGGTRDVEILIPVEDLRRLLACIDTAGSVGHGAWHYERRYREMPCAMCHGAAAPALLKPEAGR